MSTPALRSAVARMATDVAGLLRQVEGARRARAGHVEHGRARRAHAPRLRLRAVRGAPGPDRPRLQRRGPRPLHPGLRRRRTGAGPEGDRRPGGEERPPPSSTRRPAPPPTTSTTGWAAPASPPRSCTPTSSASRRSTAGTSPAASGSPGRCGPTTRWPPSTASSSRWRPPSPSRAGSAAHAPSSTRTTARGVRIRYELRVVGAPPRHFVFDDGNLTITEPGAGKVDCYVRADPVALNLIAWGRMSPWPSVARGRLRAWGRKPWLAAKLTSLLSTP